MTSRCCRKPSCSQGQDSWGGSGSNCSWFYSSFVPAKATQGRPSGGSGILCKDGQPQQRFEKGEHWHLGRWSHHLLPCTGGLHVYKIYGYGSDNPLGLEKTLALCIEVLGAVSLVREVEAGYQAAQEQNAEALWQMWCGFAESAL
eukprot:606305-Amphidinium_carterae.1